MFREITCSFFRIPLKTLPPQRQCNVHNHSVYTLHIRVKKNRNNKMMEFLKSSRP